MYVRASRWEGGDPQAIRDAIDRIGSQDGPPEGVPAKRLLALGNPDDGTVLMIPFFETEEDLAKGDETLSKMSPPGDMGTLTSVDKLEVLLDVSAPE